MKIYLNNSFVEAEKSQISALDRGLLYGQGVFETMRTIKGQVPFFSGHFERLKKGAAFVGIRFEMSRGGLKKIIEKVTEINSYDDAYIRVTLTGGDNGPRGNRSKKYWESSPVKRGNLIKSKFANPKTLMVFAHKYNPPAASFYKNGVRLALSKFCRSRSSAIIKHKTTSYLENMLAKQNAVKKKCFDSLFLDNGGFVAECATSNIFWIKRGVLRTPSLKCPILPGITRKAVINLAKNAGIKVKELNRPGYGDLQNADEVFITNSLIGVLPVQKIGKITSLLRDLYERKINETYLS